MLTREAKRRAIGFVGILTCLLFSCKNFSSFELPKSVKIETEGAEYNIPAGWVSVNFDDYIDAKKLQQKMDNTNKDADKEGYDIDPYATPEEAQAVIDSKRKMFVYDYYPNKNASTQEYIINYPISTIPLDLNQYIKANLNIDADINKKMEQSFSVPDTKSIATNEQTVTIPSVNKKLVEKFTISEKNPLSLSAAEIADTYFSSKELSEKPANWSEKNPYTKLDPLMLTFDVTVPDFKTMSFTSGSLELTLKRTDTDIVDDDFLYEMQIFLINGTTGAVISGSDVKDVSHYEKTFSLSLEGKTIVPNMKLKIDFTYGGGTSGKSHSYRITPKLADGTKIARITGLTISADELGTSQNIDVPVNMADLGDYLIKGTIRDGSMSFSALMPANWEKVSSVAEISVKGVIDIHKDKFADVGEKSDYFFNKTASLEGYEIDCSETTTATLYGTVSLSFNDSTITFTDKTVDDITIAVACSFDVTRVEKALVNIEGLIDKDQLKQTIPVSFGEVKDYIKSAKFTEFGLTGNLFTDLPAEKLNVTLSLKSSALNIPTCKDTVDIMDEKESFDIRTEKSWSKEISFATSAEFPFDVSVDFTGDDTEHPYYIMVDALNLGTTYTILPNLSLVFDWEYMIINTANLTSMEPMEQPIGFDLEEILKSFTTDNPQYEDIINHIKFSDIDGYVYLTKPKAIDEYDDPLSDDFLGTFSGEIKALYDGNDSGLDLIEPDSPLSLVSKGKSFAELADKNLTIVSPEKFMETYYSAHIKESENHLPDGRGQTVLCEIINMHPKNLRFRYKLGLSGGTEGGLKFYKKDLERLGATSEDTAGTGDTKKTVSIDISIAIRLPFKILIDDDIKIEDLLDFIGNSVEVEMPGTDEYDEYINLAKDIKCTYEIANTTGLNITAIFSDAEGLISGKELYLNSGTNTFYLQQDEIKRIVGSTENFSPIIQATIHEGSVNIPRHAQLRLSANLTIRTGGEWSKEW